MSTFKKCYILFLVLNPFVVISCSEDYAPPVADTFAQNEKFEDVSDVYTDTEPNLSEPSDLGLPCSDENAIIMNCCIDNCGPTSCYLQQQANECVLVCGNNFFYFDKYSPRGFPRYNWGGKFTDIPGVPDFPPMPHPPDGVPIFCEPNW